MLSSIALAAVFASVGRYLYSQINERFETDLAGNATRLHDAYIIQNEILAWRVRALAYSITANPEIQRLLDEGGEAARAEGNNPGGARVTRARRALQETVKPLWDDLRTYFEVQQLHFILPDSVSFLRMHAPAYFGDAVATVRPMLADFSHDHDFRGGFEIGRAYACVRGAVSIMRRTQNSNSRFVGAMEIGLDMNGHLDKLDKQLGVGIALLLDRARVTSVMWPNRRPMMRNEHSFMLAATRPEANEWFKSGQLAMNEERALKTRLLTWQDRHFLLITFALDDYKSQLEPWNPPPGTVLIWHDITDKFKQVAAMHKKTILGMLATYVAAQLCVFVLLHIVRREWIRRLKQHTATIEKLSQRNALLLDTAADGICGVNQGGLITFINRSALTMHGYQYDEVVGKSPHSLFQHHRPDGRPNPLENCPFFQTLTDGEPRECEEWLLRRDGSYFPAKMTVNPIFEHKQISGAVISFHDITDQRNRQEALLQLATTDSLTSASNRRHFMDQLDAELSRQRRHGGLASLLMTDLDYFKRVNDEHGHAAGDVVLSHFVHIARKTVRRSDVIGRLGGEEFAILLPGDGVQGARELAERLRQAFEANPARIGNIFIPATVSIGISDLRTDDMTPDISLRRADMALYAAKAA
ncbi:MAG: diguanylate cyclase, partial [Azoarcus sp.]|nr:diguanylate cyclase [Azoarcus sp.]